MATETIWELTIDPSSAVSAAEEIDAALESIAETIAAVASSLDGLSSLDEALSSVGSISDEATQQIEGLQSVIDSLSATIAEDTTVIDGLNETVANLQSQLDVLASSEDNAASGADNLSNSMNNAKSSTDDASGGFGGFVSGIGDIANTVFMSTMKFQMFSNMATQTASSLLQPAMSAETMKTAFATLMGSTQAATDEMEKLDTFASKTPFKTMDIDQAASQLIGFGISANDVVPDLTAMGDALSAVGKGSSANLMQIVNIFGKIQLGGKLTSGEMSQFSHDGINAWAILEQQTGKTQAQLQEMIKQGLIPAKDAMSMLTKGIEANPLYAGGMAKQSATMSGLLSTLQSNWDQLMTSFGTPILQAVEGDLGNLGNALASPVFKNFASSVGKEIVSVFQNISTFVKNNVMPAISGLIGYFSSPVFKSFAGDIEYLGQEIVKLDISNFEGRISSLGPILNDVGNAFKAVAGFIGTVARDVGDLIAWFMKGSEPAKALGAAITAVGIGLQAVKIAQFLETLPTLLTSLQVWAVGQWEVATAAIATAAPYIAIGAIVAAVAFGIIEAIQHWGAITSWLKGVWAALGGWFDGFLGGIKEKWGQLVSFFKGLWSNIVSGAKTAWGDVTSAAHTAGTNLQTWWHGVVTGFEKSPIGSSIIKSLQDGFGQVGQQFGQIGSTLKTQFGSALSGVETAFGNLGKTFQQIWQQDLVPVGQAIGGAFSQAWKALSGALAQVGQAIGGAFMTAWKALQGAFAAVGKAIASIPWGMIGHALAQIGSIVGGAFMTAWKVLASIFAQIGNLIGGVLLKVLEGLGILLGGIILIAISAVLGAIVGLAKAFATFIQGLSMVIGGVIKVFSGIIQIVSGIIAFIADLFTGHFNKLGTDLGVIWKGIVTMFSGIWDIIKGVFIAGIGSVIAFISGFVSTVLSFFADLASSVGIHVSGLVNNVIKFFDSLPQNVINALNALPSMIMNVWNSIITDATNAGSNIVKGIADGIKNAIHFVTDAITNVTSWISAHLPHSPAKEGPLRDLLLQGSLITEQISQGMLSNLPKLQAAIKQLTGPIALSLSAPSSPSLNASSGTSLGSNNNQTNLLLAQMLAALQVQQRQVLSSPANNTLGAVTQNFGNINVHGVNDIQSLQNALNQLSGQQLQYSQRGAVFNY